MEHTMESTTTGAFSQYRKLRFLDFPQKLAAEADSQKAVHPKRYCFVLGAGASKSSGIRTGEELVCMWDTDLCEEDETEHRRWKESLGITRNNRGNYYGAYFARRFPDPWDGHEFLESMMCNKHPGAGYAMLSSILCHTSHNIVITTNFDRMTEDAISRYQKQFPMVIGHEYLLPYFRQQLQRPYILKIHRDLLLDPKNSDEETESLPIEWQNCLGQIFQTYHPIFLGYAGNDRSLMDFLIQNAANFRKGTWRSPYWTLYGKTVLSDAAMRFMSSAGGWVVQDCDFDRFIILLGDALQVPPWPTLEQQVEVIKNDYRRIEYKMNETLPTEEKSVNGETKSFETDRIVKKSNIETYQEEISLCKQSEELSQAVTRFTGDNNQNSQSARYRKSVLLINHRQYIEAELVLRQLVTEEPNNANYHNRLSEALHKEGRYKEALVEANRAVEIKPEDSFFHNQLAVTLYKLKKHNEALIEAQRAVELEPAIAKYHCDLGAILYEMKRYEEAQIEGQLAVEIEPDNASFLYQLGVTMHAMKLYPEAEKLKKRACELAPGNANYSNGLGITLFELARHDEALTKMQKAVNLEPENALYHSGLGVVFHALKRYEEALIEKQRAVELEPNNAEYHRSLGVTLRKINRFDESLIETERAISLEPDEPRNYDSLSILFSSWGKLDLARFAKEKAEELRLQTNVAMI